MAAATCFKESLKDGDAKMDDIEFLPVFFIFFFFLLLAPLLSLVVGYDDGGPGVGIVDRAEGPRILAGMDWFDAVIAAAPAATAVVVGVVVDMAVVVLTALRKGGKSEADVARTGTVFLTVSSGVRVSGASSLVNARRPSAESGGNPAT